MPGRSPPPSPSLAAADEGVINSVTMRSSGGEMSLPRRNGFHNIPSTIHGCDGHSTRERPGDTEVKRRGEFHWWIRMNGFDAPPTSSLKTEPNMAKTGNSNTNARF
ncbi:hypothetical protein PAAG_00599 [Paracoccidioides lutzii Pb01]|uniref:Uncharacterized protein n=1 Tax=Paracoccidioides lutzii (strain ATCC MYA-826 / Pb01) TaxID=502779 RepID=C1GQ04_PARBA|nr:hypothetical protein PAAG_00599 [Paracoccidioides lutzii Pb01]EEH36276.2 hypothetical protein PAAG_00599 [Paracoccidioides lutzii Pb01]